MEHTTADMVICGAGLAGIATAYHLAVQHGVQRVLLVDERPPLSLTSDKSTECYRNWWPGPDEAMVRLMNRSIDWLERLALESDNFFHLNRRGYAFLTADPAQANVLAESAATIAALGAGPLRIHHGSGTTYHPAPAVGYQDQPEGADLLLEPRLIRQHFPFVAPDTVALLHTRRCGWLSAQQLGMYLLTQARAHGVTLQRGRVSEVVVEGGQVTGVRLIVGDRSLHVATAVFVNAAGPLLHEVGQLLGVTLPVVHELHGKVIVEDSHGVVPRQAPLMIWTDPVTLPWSADERPALAADASRRWLCEPLPAGVHFRPEGGADSRMLLLIWTYHVVPQRPVWPLRFAPEYGEVVLRGLSRMLPGLHGAWEHLSRPRVDGGYYCKTQENRPLIGPLPVPGAYVNGALSGFGIMASLAAGELLAAHILGLPLPSYAPAFLLSRYEDPAYQHLLAHWDATAGQL